MKVSSPKRTLVSFRRARAIATGDMLRCSPRHCCTRLGLAAVGRPIGGLHPRCGMLAGRVGARWCRYWSAERSVADGWQLRSSALPRCEERALLLVDVEVEMGSLLAEASVRLTSRRRTSAAARASAAVKPRELRPELRREACAAEGLLLARGCAVVREDQVRKGA